MKNNMIDILYSIRVLYLHINNYVILRFSNYFLQVTLQFNMADTSWKITEFNLLSFKNNTVCNL